MALRLNQSVKKGEIDNRLQGYVMGKIWLVGQDEPIQLSLKGNCLRDIAGCRIAFTNPDPQPEDVAEELTNPQEGIVGDMTASRKMKILAKPIEEAYRLRKEGEKVPLLTANGIYIEWFSETNGRVVIEASSFTITDVSMPEWQMTKEQETEQIEKNDSAIRGYIQTLPEEREKERERFDEFEPYTPMDEFEWEKSLKESDELTDKYSNLLDLYVDHPDRERIIAREMGWTWLDDALDADVRGVLDENTDEWDPIPPLEPDPSTEGRDWIRTDEGHVKHPLSHQAFEMAMDMWHYCHDLGLLEGDADTDLHDMLFQAQVLGAKLAGALDSLAYDHQPEGGFVVACLKRALQYFDKSLAASQKVEEKKLVDNERLMSFRNDLFEIRQEMLTLMRRYRRQTF